MAVAKYDIVVIGGGAAGLVSSGFAAAMGLDVALVSDGHPGGECLWTGCVPSKALIHYADVARVLTKHGGALPEDSFEKAMQHMRSAREKISHHDSIETIEGSYGVKVVTGRARFTSKSSIEIGGKEVSAGKFIIATGGLQKIPPVDGFEKLGCLTHESILDLDEKPDSLCIIGGGPVGVEYAQTMSRLGVNVTLVEMLDRLLIREEPETSELVKMILADEGVTVHTGYSATRGSLEGDRKIVSIAAGDDKLDIECQHVLVATGKTPATRDLNLEAVGVTTDERGFVMVDEHQRTNVPNIFACGDVCGLHQFTHYADHTAQIAAMNACFPPLSLFVKREKRVIPWCTFLDPEVASVGMREDEARRKFGADNVLALRYDLDDFDRAILDEKAVGFVKAVVSKKGEIYGTSIVGSRAGEMIHEFALAMKRKISIAGMGDLIHVYPTMSGVVRNMRSQYYRTVAADSPTAGLVKKVARWLN